MENLIPLNGRIAIVDDQIEQALPLMRVFAKNNIPYVYYKGDDADYFPEQPENDIRILLLDLNLLGGRDNQPKDISASLFSVINRIISPDNYPYVLVLWSRQEKEYKGLLEELFANALKGCAPIVILEWIKSDFFSYFSDEEENKDDEYKIVDALKKVIVDLPAYSYLMQWENCIHNSADETIQNVFHDFHSQNDWQDNANCILNMFAKSYLEKHHDNSEADEKAKASLLFMNEVYFDTLESNVSKINVPNATDLQSNVDEESEKEIAAKINECLLISNQIESIHQPGCLIDFGHDSGEIAHFYELIDNSLRTLPQKVKKDDIYQSIIPCAVVVTPACDYAQKKNVNDRIVQGVIIDSDFQKFIDNSEAIFISPKFTYESHCRLIVLNFRYFFTVNLDGTKPKYLLRLRNSLLAEIQSKLARHINRQGIMNL